MLRVVLFYILFTLLMVILSVAGLPVSIISVGAMHRISVLWGRMGLFLAGVRIEVIGADLLPDRTVIFMPNHQSQFDIPALFAGVPVPFRWMAKKELFRIPFLGMAMRRSGYIPVDREDRKGSLRGLSEAAERIASGASVVIFPEGTRSPDGNLLPFKKGGFLIALQSKVPVVPVTLQGGDRIMPKGNISFRPGTIRLQFHPPIETEGLRIADRGALMLQVEEAIRSGLEPSC